MMNVEQFGKSFMYIIKRSGPETDHCDLNKTISFVAGVLSTSFARALLGIIR